MIAALIGCVIVYATPERNNIIYHRVTVAQRKQHFAIRSGREGERETGRQIKYVD